MKIIKSLFLFISLLLLSVPMKAVYAETPFTGTFVTEENVLFTDITLTEEAIVLVTQPAFGGEHQGDLLLFLNMKDRALNSLIDPEGSPEDFDHSHLEALVQEAFQEIEKEKYTDFDSIKYVFQEKLPGFYYNIMPGGYIYIAINGLTWKEVDSRIIGRFGNFELFEFIKEDDGFTYDGTLYTPAEEE